MEYDMKTGECVSDRRMKLKKYRVVAPAVLFGLAWGLFQGTVMVWLRLGSTGATLGGLLTLGGLAYVVTGNLSISYPRRDVALAMNDPVLDIFSSPLIALAAFLVAAFFMARTRVGRDAYATGSDSRAAWSRAMSSSPPYSHGGSAALGGRC
jgi:ribose/xylose/arabinose/galactoside ABC-type transport system permease subunit